MGAHESQEPPAEPRSAPRSHGENEEPTHSQGSDARVLHRLQAELRHVESQRALLSDRLLAAEQRQAMGIARPAGAPDDPTRGSEGSDAFRLERLTDAEARRDLAAAQTRIAELEHVLSVVQSSESWRLTAPVRFIGRCVRALAGRRPTRLRRQRVVELTKPFVPVPLRRYLRRRFPGAVYVRPRPSPGGDYLKAVLFVSGAPELSRRYRCDHQAEQLELLGATAGIAIHGEVDLLTAATRYRHFVLHRVPWGPDVEAFLNRVRLFGALVVFDTDDLVFDPDVTPHVAALEDLSPYDVELYEEGLHRYRRTLQGCDAVSASTGSLAEQAGRIHDRVVVTPNVASVGMIDAAQAASLGEPRGKQKPTSGSAVTIGYLSGTNTHKKDFLEAADALLAVLERRPRARLLIVGPLIVDSRFDRFPTQIERLPFQAWERFAAIQASVDVNLAPLEPSNPFTDAKSSVKWIEASIAGVPTIASPRPDFQRVVEHGRNGLLAEGHDAWERALFELVDSPELRAQIGRRAREDALRLHTTRAAAPRYYDTVRSLVPDASAPLTINWIMQSPIAGNSGGYRNIFRIAFKLGSYGHVQRFCIDPVAHLSGLSDRRIREFVDESFGLPANAKVVVGHASIDAADVSIATFWPTAFTVAAHSQSLFKAYFIQDFEPEFYERSDLLYEDAAKTYELPLRHICLGRHLGNRLTELTGLPADVVDFALDPHFRLTTPPEERGEPVRLLFFARPSLRRRGYELGLEALRLVKDARPDVEIVFFGTSSHELGKVPFEMRNLGLLEAGALANAMNSAHILLAFSLTNISNVPFEGMACGCAVVDVDLPNVATMVEPGRNCVLAPLDPEAIARAVIELVDDRELRARLGRQAAVDARTRTWARTARMFEDSLLRLCFARLEPGGVLGTEDDEGSAQQESTAVRGL